MKQEGSNERPWWSRYDRPALRSILVLLIVGLILLLLILLQPERRRTAAYSGCQKTASPTTVVRANLGQSEPVGALKIGDYFVQGQVIVTGPRAKIDELIGPSGTLTNLLKLEDCDLKYLGGLQGFGELASQYFPFPPAVRNQLVMRLYEIMDAAPVETMVRRINTAGSKDYVFADTNYLTSLMANNPCGNPETIGGSPETIGGSPFTIGGSTIVVTSSQGISPTGLFWNQWAFEHIGIGPSVQERVITDTGAGIWVGVFDTSPFDDTELPVGQSRAVTTSLSPALTLTASHPVTVPALALPLTPTTIISKGVSDHGLFVSGLVHAVAPSSTIHLFRVLNEYGCGDLFRLNDALHVFVSQVISDRAKLDGAVINLSLGLRKPMTDTDALESLLTAVVTADEAGIVLVAAAGNDSWRKHNSEGSGLESTPLSAASPLAPQLPAAYPFVIGAASSNVNRQRSCFSNWGDVYAPGGEGGPGTRNGVEVECAPKIRDCNGDCEYALISVATDHPAGFGYWSGTSFAAPLVSGLAALTLDAGVRGQTWMPPNEVAWAIHCGTALGDGVINVPVTLVRCIGSGVR